MKKLMLLLVILLIAGAANAAIIYVPADYSTIASAVSNASTDDVIMISPGTYNENEITINKRLTITSQWYTSGDANDIDQVVIDVGGVTLFTITANDVEISGVKIINGDHTLNIEARVTVKYCHFVNNSDDVSMEGNGGGYVGYCTFTDGASGDDAIDLDIGSDGVGYGFDIEIEHCYIDTTGDELLPGSQSIDAGVSTYVWNSETIIDMSPSEYIGSAPDLGAHEYLLGAVISGHILGTDDAPVEGVSVTADNGGGSDTTDVDGYYELYVSLNWSGTVTPTKVEYTFVPTSRAYTNVIADQTNQDYTGTYVPDLTPPAPDPATFASGPVAISSSEITMTATTGNDPSDPVEYLFTETSGNPGGSSSSWQISSTYIDNGLSEDTEYCYTVKMRDAVLNEGGSSASACATTNSAPPTPNPATFASPPAGLTLTAMIMTATTGVDDTGPVEYFFDATDGGNDSGWITNPIYIDSGLAEDTTYTYTVTMRDALLNTGGTSSGAAGTTLDSEYVLEQNNNENDKMEVYGGFEGSQSFKYGSGGGPTYQITKVEILLSKEGSGGSSPDTDFEFTIGTGINGGPLPNSDINITPGEVTNTSGGSSFQTFILTFASPVGSLTAGTTYYLNYEVDSGNGKKYFVGYDGNGDYSDGTYYKDGSDDGKDSYFIIYGSTPNPPDTDAPLPNAATFAFFPEATGTSSIIMSATTGADVTGPVEYYFDETINNPGGSDSGWQTSPSYTDSGLSSSTQYTYTVTMRDSAPAPNAGAASPPASATTFSEVSISGYIENINDVPVEGVSVIADNGGGTDMTEADGYYEVLAPYGWSGNVATAKEDYTFTPDDPPYSNVIVNQSVDIAATLDADIEENGIVEVADLATLCENWLMAGDLSTGDLDGSGFIDILDISEMAEYWQK